MTGASTRRIFRFGAFEADEGTGELRKHGVRVKLHAQPFQVLVMLLRRPGDVVTREEIRLGIWGEDTFVDFDHGLNSAINKVRDALSDSAARPRYVETVAGKGYRFIAPVSEAAKPSTAAAPSAPAAVLSTPEDLPAASRKVVRILLLLVQALYLGFYLSALANLGEIGELFREARMFSPRVLMAVLVGSAAMLIPVRLYLAAAVGLDFRQLPAKFARMFPALLAADLLWALSPFLLVHYVSVGFALGLSAILVYLPFSQRSLVLMYSRV